MNVPDNYDIAQYIISDRERLERLHERFEREDSMEYDAECELPFVTVPNDYGQHNRELYYGGNEDVNK